MSLLSRLVAPAPGEVKIPVHQFMAAIAEARRGAPGGTVSNIAEAFNLSTNERSALVNWYVAQVETGNVSRELVHDVLMLGEGGIYSLTQVSNRLGLSSS